MSGFEKNFERGIPFTEAASYFIELRDFGKTAEAEVEEEVETASEKEASVAVFAARFDETISELRSVAQDLGTTLEEATKTAAAPYAERFHPGTFNHHGSVMKTALMHMKQTVFVPEIDEEGNIKEAAANIEAKFAAAAAKLTKEKDANMGGPMSLPPGAQGQNMAPPPPPALAGPSAGQHKMAELAARFAAATAKLAFSGGEGTPAASPSIEDGGEASESTELDAYLQQELEGRQAEEAGQLEFYKAKFEEAAQQLEQVQQQAAQTEQQVAELQEQVAQSQNVQAAAQQVQNAAMQNAQAAQMAASQAMQRSLAESNEKIQQQQLAVQIRDWAQDMRAGLQQMIMQTPPPATTMEAGISDASAMQQAQVQMQAQEQQAAMAQDPNAQAAAGGDPAAAAAGGQAPTEAAPAQAEAAPPAQAEEAPAEPKEEKTEPKAEKKPPAATVSIKTAADAFYGALAGGALGAAGTAVESRMSNDPLRKKVKKLEAIEQSGGGFGNALNLAQAKARLAIGEVTEKHPVASTLAGGAIGALTGASAGPGILSALRGS